MSAKKWSILLAVMVIAGMLLTACPSPAPQAAATTPTAGATAKKLRIVPGTGTYPDTIDPQKSSFVGEIAHLKLIYEGLTRFDNNLKTIPAAAEKWEYNKDATELTFTLRKDLKYSDGSLLNAKRFEYSVLRNINPTTAGEYAQITDEIKGAPEWRSFVADAKASTADNAKKEADLKAAVQIKSLHADGAACDAKEPYKDSACNTLKMIFSKPAPYFHTVMSLWVTYPAKEENIAAGGENWWSGTKFQIGNGPYILKTLEQNQRGYFVPNPNYWKGVAKTDIEFSYITDTSVSLAAYKNNELDMMQWGAEDTDVINKDAVLSKEANLYAGSCTYAVMFHQQKEPFTDPKVRQAFAQALDRTAWVKDVLKGIGTPTLTWIPKGFPGYDDKESRWAFDAAAAKKALSESKYGSADKLPPIKLTFADTPRNRTRYEWLAAKFKEVLGVNTTLDPVEATAYTALTKDIKTAPQMYILGWCSDYPDPQNWLSVYWKTGGFGQRIGYSNKDLDAMIDLADTETNADKRMTLYHDAQVKLTDGVPVGFMWNNANNFLIKPWVKGIAKTPQDSDFPGSNDPSALDVDLTLLPKK
jgi:oligopeptide transport system substrate-binding protein